MEDDNNKQPSELPSEDRKLGRAPLSASEGGDSDGPINGIEHRTVKNQLIAVYYMQ